MELEIESLPNGVRLHGEMTVYSAATLKPALLESTPGCGGLMQVDLTGVTEFDSAGMQLLLMLKRHPNVSCVRITAASQAVISALTLCRLQHLVEPLTAVETAS
jgi:anti-sigma B factor antagonist